MSKTVSHLDILESESIHILRETVAQFRKPVLLYSMGKDSTVLLHRLCMPPRIPVVQPAMMNSKSAFRKGDAQLVNGVPVGLAPLECRS
jgi:sulfate adenylyltransferase subunit 2